VLVGFVYIVVCRVFALVLLLARQRLFERARDPRAALRASILRRQARRPRIGPRDRLVLAALSLSWLVVPGKRFGPAGDAAALAPSDHRAGGRSVWVGRLYVLFSSRSGRAGSSTCPHVQSGFRLDHPGAQPIDGSRRPRPAAPPVPDPRPRHEVQSPLRRPWGAQIRSSGRAAVFVDESAWAVCSPELVQTRQR